MKSKISHLGSLLFVCVLTLICLNAVNATAKKAKPKPAYVDLGIDTAMVKTQTNLFVNPDTSSTKVSTLRPGDLTVLVSRDVKNGWCNVIQFSSGRQGWVRSNRLFSPSYTKHPSAGTVLTGVPLGTATPPVIEVTNDTNVNLYLHLDNLAEVSVSPHQTKSLEVRAGIFSFNAAGPNLRPDFGYMAFLDGERYPWRFFVRTASQAKEKGTLSPALHSEYNTLLATIKSQNAENAIEKQQLDADRLALHKQQDETKIELDYIDANQHNLDHSDEDAVNAFNILVRKANADLLVHEKLLDQFNTKVDAYNSHLHALDAPQHRLDEIEHSVNAR